jgi:hypothetical protein
MIGGLILWFRARTPAEFLDQSFMALMHGVGGSNCLLYVFTQHVRR